VRIDDGMEAEGSITYRVLDSPDWVRQVYDGEDLHVYELSEALPLAWGVNGASVLANEEAVLERIGDPAFDPGAELLFTASDVPENFGEPTEPSRLDAEVVDDEPEELTVHTNFAADGFLVISNRYDDDWRAKVDGEDAELLRANTILQAVQVPAGEHTVHLSFEPDERAWGSRISVGALVLMMGGGARGRLRGRSGGG
jgi:hypothetical protein